MPRKTATVIDETGVEVGRQTITPIDLNALQAPTLTAPPAVITDAPLAPYTPPAALWPYYTETVPARIKEAIVSGTFLEYVAPVCLASSVVVGIDLVNAVVEWFSSILPALIHAAEVVALLAVIVIIITFIGGRSKGSKEIWLKGCPSRNPGSFKVRIK